MKLSYIKIYLDNKSVIDALTDEEAGRVFKFVVEYGIKENAYLPEGRERLVCLMLAAQIDRDSDYYDEVVDKRRKSGKMGGRPKQEQTDTQNCAQDESGAHENQMDTADETETQQKAKKANGYFEKQKKQMVILKSKKSKEKEEEKEEEKEKEYSRRMLEKRACAREGPSSIQPQPDDGESKFGERLSAEPRDSLPDYISACGIPMAPDSWNDLRERLNEGLTQELCRHAINTAVDAGSKSWKYITRILDRYAECGIKTPEMAVEASKKFKAQHSTQRGKIVSAQAYAQRAYTEDDLAGDSENLIRKAAEMT